MPDPSIREFLVRYLMDNDFHDLVDNSPDEALAQFDFSDDTVNAIKSRDENLLNIVYSSQLELPKPSKKREPLDYTDIQAVAGIRMKVMFVKAVSIRTTYSKMALVGGAIPNDPRPSIFFRASVPSTPESRPESVSAAAKEVLKASPDERRARLRQLMVELVDDI